MKPPKNIFHHRDTEKTNIQREDAKKDILRVKTKPSHHRVNRVTQSKTFKILVFDRGF